MGLSCFLPPTVVLYPSRMYSLFGASKTLIMDFFLKRSLSCLLLSFNSQLRKTRVTQTNTSELLVMATSDKEFCGGEIADTFI